MPGAAGTGVTTRYDLTNPIKEDLEDIIYDISPMDTFCLTKFSRTKVSSTLHEWQIDALRAPAANAQVEGMNFSATAAANTSRLKNYTQISVKEIVVSGTMSAVDTAGYANTMGYLLAKYGKELKRDIELAILSRNEATAGVAASARVSAGLQTFLETSLHIHPSSSLATTTAWMSTGIPNSSSVVGSATTTAFTSAILETALAVAWANGGETDTVLMSAKQKAIVNTFTGIATRFREVGSGMQAQVIGAADVFVSSFGDHKLVISRYIEADVVLCLDTAQWAVGYLRNIQTTPISKVGDAERRMILAEWTLIGKEPHASTKITALS
jgi:Family of unknown function (DUF5309)